MSSIFGWNTSLPREAIDFILTEARSRGRDGWGVLADGETWRGIGDRIPLAVIYHLYKSKRVIGSFYSEPTTQQKTSVAHLQPYENIVHNGTIEKYCGKNIDLPNSSMILPVALRNEVFGNLLKLQGSYAIAIQYDVHLVLACNYKPIYYMNIEGGIAFASQEYMLPKRSHKIEPYSYNVISEQTIVTRDIPRTHNRKAAVALSGGLDSTTAAYMLKDLGYEVTGVYFTYGCLAQEQELKRVEQICKAGGFEFVVLKMPDVMGGSIVEGHYKEDGLAGSSFAYDWVSARNLLMLSILTAFCETNKISNICFGGNLEESDSYPDNEEEFARLFNKLLPYCIQNGTEIQLLHPLSTLMKKEIVEVGIRLKVPYELTWSCYGNGEHHCNKCGPCYMRKMAFKRNGLEDPAFAHLQEGEK